MPTFDLPSLPGPPSSVLGWGIDFASPLALLLLVVLLPLFWLIARRGRRAPPHPIGFAPAPLAGPPRLRDRLSLALRLAVVGLIVLALAQPRLWRPSDTLDVLFLVDLSDSVGPRQRQQALEFIREAAASKGERDRLGVVAFAAEPLVELPLTTAPQIGELASAPGGEATNIASALRLAVGLLPRTSARRIVLLSDGNENLEQAREEARVARAAEIPIAVVPLAAAEQPEVLVRAVEGPARLRIGERFTLRVTVESTTEGEAQLFLLTDGRVDRIETVSLRAGSNTFAYEHEPLAPGFHTFMAQVQGGLDTRAENNQAAGFAEVSGAPRVLLVEGAPGEGEALAGALAAAQVDAERRGPAGLPADLAALRDFDAVILVDVPTTELDLTRQRLLQSYVRDLGGGLVVVGGEHAFGPGGYAGTPLEETLPLDMEPSSQRQVASAAVVFIIVWPEYELGVNVTKEAAKASLDLLTARDLVAANDGGTKFPIPLQPAVNKPDLRRQIDEMDHIDPPSYKPALEASHQVLKAASAYVKHCILISDGDAVDDYKPTIEAMVADGITLSVIGTNVIPSDLQRLQDMARWGRGRYYDGNDPYDIPRIMLEETRLSARPAIVEQPFQPTVVSDTPALAGLAPGGFPTLRGYVATSTKPTAEVALVSHEGDPILAEWQYGLGRVAAWTSDASARWAADWLTWPGFSQFWGQIVKRTLPARKSFGLQTSVRQGDGVARITVDASAAAPERRNFLRTRAIVALPGGEQMVVPLAQTAAARYEGEVLLRGEGAYLVQVTQQEPSGEGTPIVASDTAGFVVPYSAEYATVGTRSTLLDDLARLSGGEVISEPAAAFAHTLPAIGGPQPIWPWCLGLALLLFMADVAARRLRLRRGDLTAAAAVLARTRGWLPRAEPTPTAAGRLLHTRGRAGRQTGEPGLPTDRPGRPAAPAPPPPGAPGRPPPSRRGTLGSRLLDAKRRATDESEGEARERLD